MGTSTMSVEILTLFLCQCEIQSRSDFWHYYWAGSKSLLNHILKSLLVLYLQAANYLNIKNLLDLTCQTVADMIKGKTPEEIRKTFNIKNDFTPEEEEEVRRENQWAFEWIFSFQMSDSCICNWKPFSVSSLSLLVSLFCIVHTPKSK